LENHEVKPKNLDDIID